MITEGLWVSSCSLRKDFRDLTVSWHGASTAQENLNPFYLVFSTSSWFPGDLPSVGSSAHCTMGDDLISCVASTQCMG